MVSDRPCAHCGRVGALQASAEDLPLCHTDWMPDRPLEEQDDCYRLVTVYGEDIGARLPGFDLVPILQFLGVRNNEDLLELWREISTDREGGKRNRHPYFNKAGLAIGSFEQMFLSDNRNYKQVLDSMVYPAEGERVGVRVSTIWTGMNTRSFGLPHIFETMIFSDVGELDPDDEATWSYPTLEAAWTGHFDVVDKVMARGPESVLEMCWDFMGPEMRGPFNGVVPAWLQVVHEQYSRKEESGAEDRDAVSAR